MKPKPASAAILTIRRPGAMTYQDRKDIARWLRRQGMSLVAHGDAYVTKGNFTARFNYPERK